MLTCTRCGRHMEHIESTIGNSPYCHPDAGPDCYRITSLECALSVSSMPQRFMTGMPPVTPMHDTPIYAQLKADREGRGRYSVGGLIKSDGMVRMMYVPAPEPHLKYPETAATPTSRALLKKGRKR